MGYNKSQGLPVQHIVVIAQAALFTKTMNKIWEVWVKGAHSHNPRIKTKVMCTMKKLWNGSLLME